MKVNNNNKEFDNLDDFDITDFVDDEDDLDWDYEDDLPSDSWADEENGLDCITAVRMKNIVSYFEINGISGVIVFSGKGVEIRSLYLCQHGDPQAPVQS